MELDDKLKKRLSYSSMAHVWKGQIIAAPKKKEQKGFRGFPGEGGQPYTISCEVVRIANTDYGIYDIYDIKRNAEGELIGLINFKNKVRRVTKQPVLNPSPSNGITYKGTAMIWVLS